MTDEAVLLVQLESPVPFTVADGTGIEKGTLLKMTSPRTASAASAATDMIAGIAASEKIANDGKTSLGVYRRGIFKMTLSGTDGCVAIGQGVTQAAGPANYITSGSDISSGSMILGQALATGAKSESIAVDLNIGSSTYNKVA